MKLSSVLFRGTGFVIQYILPIVLFGFVVPYSHGTLKAGLTGAGWAAAILIAAVLIKKSREFVLTQKKSLFRAILLTGYSIMTWAIVMLCIRFSAAFLTGLATYWKWVLGFVIVGRLFYIVDEAGE